jgi:hypothetical protein
LLGCLFYISVEQQQQALAWKSTTEEKQKPNEMDGSSEEISFAAANGCHTGLAGQGWPRARTLGL